MFKNKLGGGEAPWYSLSYTLGLGFKNTKKGQIILSYLIENEIFFFTFWNLFKQLL